MLPALIDVRERARSYSRSMELPVHVGFDKLQTGRSTMEARVPLVGFVLTCEHRQGAGYHATTEPS